jgi:hypothetical protein
VVGDWYRPLEHEAKNQWFGMGEAGIVSLNHFAFSISTTKLRVYNTLGE